ncbi:MFS transporter [Paenibacillus larvae]
MKLQSIHPIGLNIIIGTFFARLATSMSIPFLSIYLTATKGFSPNIVGAIIGTSALIGVCTSFIGGTLSDRYGRKMIMISSIIVWMLVFIGFSFANDVLSFFILSALNGICRSFFEPASRALLSDLTKSENRLLIFNLRYAAINAGVAVGPIIGLQLGSAKSTIPFVVAAFVYFLYMTSLIIQFIKYKLGENKGNVKERVTIKDSIHILRKDRVFLSALIGIILGYSGYSHFSSSLSQYFANSDVFQDGVSLFSHALVLNAVTVLIIQYPVTQIGKKYSAVVSIMFGTFTISLSLIGFGIIHSLWMVYACTILFTIGEVLIFSMTDLFIDQIAIQNLKGTYFGAMGFSSFGGVIGPWLGGILFDYYGYNSGGLVFIILSGICALGIPVLIFVKLLLNRRVNQKVTNVEKVVR